MMLQLDGLSDVQRAAPMSAAQLGYQLILTTLLQHTLYVLAYGLLELHLGLFQLLLLLVGWHVRAFGVRALAAYVRGQVPGRSISASLWAARDLSPDMGIAVLGIAVGWSVEHLAVKFALLLGYRLWFSLSLLAGTIAAALVGGFKRFFVARATPVVAASKSVALYGTLHIAYAQFSLRRMTTLPHLYRL